MVKIKKPRDRKHPKRQRKSAVGDGGRNRSDERTGRGGKEAAGKAGEDDRWLYGHHAVAACLQNPARRPERLLATRNAAERLKRDWPPARPEIVERPVIDAALPPGAVHQGVAVLAPPLTQPALEDVIATAEKREKSLVVALDQVTDPQNVGAILRSAAAFGTTAVLMPRRHAPPISGALAKAASGAIEHVPLVSVGNLDRALEQLQGSGFWCIGLDADADKSIADVDPAPRQVLVMGAEGSGLRRLTAKRCDLMARLPTRGPIATLNVSSAAAVALYELSRHSPA
ncbi:MAG: 23S rRNA (guanosine(2251)-2'-O)-methyltransferase RlmB [Pseudomonadota bacterium]